MISLVLNSITVDGKKSCTSWDGKYPHYLQGFIHPRWCRISSINSITLFLIYQGCFLHCGIPPTESRIPATTIDTNTYIWVIDPGGATGHQPWLSHYSLHCVPVWGHSVVFCTREPFEATCHKYNIISPKHKLRAACHDPRPPWNT